MNDLQLGDQIDIVFADAPGHSARATVTRLLSDQQEGLSSEAEDYIFCWLEICPEQSKHISTDTDHNVWRRLEILHGWTRSEDQQVFKAGILAALQEGAET